VEREKRDKQTKKKDKSVAHEGAASASVSSSQTDSRVQVIDLETINSAELYVDPKINAFANISIDPIRQLCLAADKQVFISIHVLTWNYVSSWSITPLIRFSLHYRIQKVLDTGIPV